MRMSQMNEKDKDKDKELKPEKVEDLKDITPGLGTLYRAVKDPNDPKISLIEWKCSKCDKWTNPDKIHFAKRYPAKNVVEGQPFCDICFDKFVLEKKEDFKKKKKEKKDAERESKSQEKDKSKSTEKEEKDEK